MPNPWGVDLAQRTSVLKIVSERLSLVRYVFLVQIEDGIATATQRASLEYADAVLIGWPEEDAPDLIAVTDAQYQEALGQVTLMEEYIDRFRTMEQHADIDGMTDTLIRITERVAHVRRTFQPKFLLPTFAEIRRVVQDEWDEDMGRIDSEGESDADTIRSLQGEFDALGDGSGASGE
ncbi:phosphoribosylglycinamide synthetase [Bifidobacterium pseudolongum]|nr:phosphoribosylglycinamide synthetase [Bifidobacterium pseudolongum]